MLINHIDHAKIYDFTRSEKHAEESCQYCTVCSFLIAKQRHFIKCHNSVHLSLKHFSKRTN